MQVYSNFTRSSSSKIMAAIHCMLYVIACLALSHHCFHNSLGICSWTILLDLLNTHTKRYSKIVADGTSSKPAAHVTSCNARATSSARAGRGAVIGRSMAHIATPYRLGGRAARVHRGMRSADLPTTTSAIIGTPAIKHTRMFFLLLF